MGGVGGQANAFARFTVSQVLGPGSGWRLPRGLRRLCRGIPLVCRAHPGKKPGGSRLRPRPRTGCTARGRSGCTSSSLGTSLASRLETRGVNQGQVNGTGVHGGGSRRTAVTRCTPTHDDHRHEAGGHRDRPLGTAIARRAPADDDRRDETGAGVDGHRALATAVTCSF